MMKMAAMVLALSLIAGPVTAQGISISTDAKSGVVLPKRIGDMKRGEQRDLSDGAKLDVMTQYGTATEPVTVYVYRSSYPNPALWLSRTLVAMGPNVGAVDDGAEPTRLRVGGASADNGLMRVLSLPEGGQWKTTAVAIVQAGEWIVKVRMTSSTLDPQSLTTKMRSMIDGLRFKEGVGNPVPLVEPEPCAEPVRYTGISDRSASEEERMTSALWAVVAEGRARARQEGLARTPQDWCRMDTAIPTNLATVYRLKAGKDWVGLLGDAGVSMASMTTDMPDARSGLFVSNPRATQSVDVLTDVIEPARAILPILRLPDPADAPKT